jgi:hypothetical protein
VTVFTPSPEPEPLGPPEPISQEEFQKLLAEGMWADRADMADSAEWVRRIRGDNTNRTGWSR